MEEEKVENNEKSIRGRKPKTADTSVVINDENLNETTEVEAVVTEKNEPKKKEKKVKVKKERKKLTKKQTLILIFSIVGVVVLAVCGFGIYLLIDYSKKLPTPTNLSVYKFDDTVYIECDKCERAVKYVFSIKQSTADNPIVMEVETNKIDVSTLFASADTYTISAKYLGKLKKANSDITEDFVYENKIQLATPTIQYIDETGKLVWVPVVGATSYRIYYTATNYEPVSANNLTSNMEFDLQDYFDATSSIKSGIYSIKLMAVGDSIHLNSGLSNKVDVEYGFQIAPVQNLSYLATKKVNFSASASATGYKIKVYTGDEDNSVNYEYTFTPSSSQANYSVDVSPYINDSHVYKVEVIALGDGEYSRDSTATAYEVA